MMTIHLQPPGSLVCVYFAVMNACERAGIPVPELAELKRISPPMSGGGTPLHSAGDILTELGWTTMSGWIPWQAEAQPLVTRLLAARATVLLAHNHMSGPRGMEHAVIADKVHPDGLSVVCSVNTRQRIPWTIQTEEVKVGIGHPIVAAWPPDSVHQTLHARSDRYAGRKQ